MAQIRVRFAPSPTGSLHIGSVRTALFNWLFARKYNGVFILRLEDTDLERNLKEAETDIMSSLRWLGLNWDEGPDAGGLFGPYRQSERSDLYRNEAHRLLENGAAYQCYCTSEELALQREEARQKGLAPRYDGQCRHLDDKARREREARGIRPTLRIKVPLAGATVVHDLIRGDVEFENKTLDDFIIMKSNGLPTYNFACVVDDSLMRITHVIRAEEHLSNTPKQIFLYRALGYQPPVFAHAPMILAPDRSKLSKRHGATSVEEFRSDGFFPEALVNYLVLLGWSPGDEREIMTVEEITSAFSLEAISRHAAIYDTRKLTWLNARYLNAFELERVVKDVLPFFHSHGFIKTAVDDQADAYIKKSGGSSPVAGAYPG
jgi:glutamyl-tRNA synthetase (EC 6.1.1.17)